MRFRKEIQIFKEVYQHSLFGDHVQEVRFEQPICLTGIKVGAAPGTGPGATVTPHIHLFAYDLSTLGAARFAVLTENCTLPTSGTKAVRIEAVVTNTVVLRGHYQTLPVALYGWTIASDDEQWATPLGAELAFSFSWEAPDANTQAFAGMPFSQELPKYALEALRPLLSVWERAGASERRLKEEQLPSEVLSAVNAAADRMCSALPSADAPLSSPAALYYSSRSGQGLSRHALGGPGLEGSPAALPEEVAEMAAAWAQLLVTGPASGNAANFGLAGIAACLLVVSCPRYAAHFLAVNGVAVLTSALALARPPFQVIRYALAALEAVTRACGPAGCDVAMGWWCPPLPASWSPPPKEAKANGVMPKRSSKEQVLQQQGADHPGRQAAALAVEHTPASTEPTESDAVASVKPESIKEEDSAAEQQESFDQHTDEAYMEGAAQDDQGSLEDEHAEENDADQPQEYEDVYEQEGQDDADYHNDTYDDVNGEGEAGDAAAAGEGAEDDYGQVYDDADAGEDPQVEEEGMQEQAGPPDDYADDEDLYNDIVPGIGQVDGEWDDSDEEDRKSRDRWAAEPAAERWRAGDPHSERWTASPAPEDQPPAAGNMLEDMLAETPERLSSQNTDVNDAATPRAANGTRDAAAERAVSERPENHKEGKRKREEIKWEPGSAQRSKKSRSDRQASRDREHKHKHKEKTEGKEKEKKHKHKDKEKDKSKEKDRDREPEKDKDRDRERDREREREQEREREAEKQRDRDREKARDRERDRREQTPLKDRRDRSSDRDARRAPSKYEDRARDRALSSDRSRVPEREREKERERPPPRDLLKEARERREAARKDAARAGWERREAEARQPPARHPSAPREPPRRPDDRERHAPPDRREHKRDQEMPPASWEAPTVHADRHAVEAAAPREELSVSADPQLQPTAVKAEPQELQRAQNERQAGKRQRQAGEDEKARAAALARQQRRERDRDVERAQDRIKREREAFGGCYAPVLEAMLQPLPKQVAVFGARLLARLSVVGAVAKFQEAAEELARMHALNASPDSSATQVKIQEVAACLTAVADSLAASGQAAQQPVNPIVSALQGQDVAQSLGAAVEPDSCALAALATRRALHLVAACMHVPAVHASMLEQSGLLQPPSTAQAVMTRLGAPMVQALQRLLAVLLSSAGGQDLVLHNPVAMGALLKALDPEADPYGPVFASESHPPRRSSEHLGTVLRAALAAGQAAGTLVSAVGLHSPRVTAAVRGLVELLPWEPARRAALCAISCRTGALNRLLDLVRDPLHPQPADADKPEQQWRAGSLYGAALLQALVADDQPQSLQAWATAAPAVLDAVAEAQAACSSSEEGQKDGGAAERLIELRSRVEGMLALREKGIDTLFSSLDSLLPPLVASDAEVKDEGKKKLKPPRVVRAEAAKEMLRSTARRAKAETALHLLHAVVAGVNGAHIGLAAADVTGIQVCDRALRTALAGLQASDADEACAVLAGDALDDMAVATNRLQLISFVAASAKATNALLQRMTHARVEFNSSSLLESLLAAHRCCSNSVESLAALSGSFGMPGTSTLLQARQALARALKAWVENENWAPELMPAILASGGKSPAAEPPLVPAQGPHEMLACASLLGDLFPAAWPPSGAARLGQGSHAPPAHMRYRAALAKSFEPLTQEALRTLMACAAASDSLTFRAALVRLCARASGLGGGMGAFVVKPLQEELAETCQHDRALADARRCLEVLVPLAYRPAIKAAMLDSGISVTLGQLLARLLPALTDATKAAEAAALTTMVLEIVNVLCNLDICLDPALAPEQRALEDCINPNEAASVVAVLLAGLTRLGGNAYIAKRLIMMLAAHAPSRAALRAACGRWRAQATGLQDDTDGSNAAAVQWAISRLWQQGQGAGEQGMQAVFTDVADALRAVAAAEDDSSAAQPSPAPAPQRFAAAVQAALASDAQPVQGEDELAETSDPMTLVHDSATRMFWRNVNARSGNAPVNKLGRKPARYDIPEGVPVPSAVELLGEGFTAAKRPRAAMLGSGEKIAKDEMLSKLGSKKSLLASPAASAKSSPSTTLPRPSIDPIMSGVDVPAVVAPPGRTRATARMRQQGNSLSRPSSVHVDDYQRGVGGKQDAPTPRASGPGRPAQPGGPGQRGPPHAPSPGGPSLQKLLSDPAVVANLNNPQKLQQLLEQYPILVQALQSGGLR